MAQHGDDVWGGRVVLGDILIRYLFLRTKPMEWEFLFPPELWQWLSCQTRIWLKVQNGEWRAPVPVGGEEVQRLMHNSIFTVSFITYQITSVLSLKVFISFSRNNKMYPRTSDCDRFSSSYSYVANCMRMARLINVVCASSYLTRCQS